MQIYKEIINPEIISDIKKEISANCGLILIEWAMLIED
jgi:hypothetical protein